MAEIKIGDGKIGVNVPTHEQIAQTQAILDKINPPFQQVLGVVLRGLLTSGPPGIPPHVLMNVIAYQTGSLLAHAIQADIATLAGIRRGFIECFSQGVRAAPIVQPAPQPSSLQV